MTLNILVADDDPLMRTLVAISLGDMAETTQATDGDQALALLEQDEFDLAIIDWDMPGTDGLDVIKTIRAHGSQVPVIMVTAEAEREQVIRAIRAGVSDYLTKPFDGGTLRAKVKKIAP
jgi:two-component system chemotaxis response regulator CheY